MSDEKNVLEIDGLEKNFGDKKVLKGVNLKVPEKKVFGFVGKNGAGKTTTMKLILGLIAPDSGEIRVEGEKVTYGDTKTNRFLGYLPDVPEYYTFMTASEYLCFCGEITKMDRKDIKSRSAELLRLVGLENEKHRIKGFSRGMKQRLGIAQALLTRPKLLICDEPTSALDPIGRKEILDILVAAKEETTILFSTHILSDVERICDEMALLNDGRIVLEGSIEEVKKNRREGAIEIQMLSKASAVELSHIFLTDLNDSGNLVLNDDKKLKKLLYYLADTGMPFIKIEKQEPTLEDIFLDVIGREA